LATRYSGATTGSKTPSPLAGARAIHGCRSPWSSDRGEAHQTLKCASRT
jgi:hypothetical protein